MLDDILTKDEEINLQKYFSGLTNNTSSVILASTVSDYLNIDVKKAYLLLQRCFELNIVKAKLGVRCPECGNLIKKLDLGSQDWEKIDDCYICDEQICIHDEDLIIVFELLVTIPPFDAGQQVFNKKSSQLVAQSDTAREMFFSNYNFVSSILPSNITEAWDENRQKRIEEAIRQCRELNNDIMKTVTLTVRRNGIIKTTLLFIVIILAIVVCVEIFKKNMTPFELNSIIEVLVTVVIFGGISYIGNSCLPTDMDKVIEKIKSRYGDDITMLESELDGLGVSKGERISYGTY
jgi:hypothetical protein